MPLALALERPSFFVLYSAQTLCGQWAINRKKQNNKSNKNNNKNKTNNNNNNNIKTKNQ